MKQINDFIFESLFRKVIIDDYNEEIDSIPSNESLKQSILLSQEFEVRTKKLIIREQRNELFEKIFNYGKRAGAVFSKVVKIE